MELINLLMARKEHTVKITLSLSDGKPTAEFSLTQKETVALAPALNRWADIAQELMTSGDQQIEALVPVFLTTVTTWMAEHPAATEKVVTSFFDALAKAVSEAKAQANTKQELFAALLALSALKMH